MNEELKSKKKKKKEKANQEIDKKKKCLKLLSSLEEDNISISKSINNCINLLNESAKNEMLNKKLNAANAENINNLFNILNKIENQKQSLNESIKQLKKDINNN